MRAMPASAPRAPGISWPPPVRPPRPAALPVAEAAEEDDVVLHVQPTREEARVDRLGPLDDEGETVPYRPPSFDLLDPADGSRPFDPEEIEENK